MSELAFSKVATVRILLTEGVSDNIFMNFFAEVKPYIDYQGGMWTLKQINKWIKSNKL